MDKIAEANAPSNIALCKYWGKRDSIINLPYNSSLSISLGDKGTITSVEITTDNKHQVILNNNIINNNNFYNNFYIRIINFIELLKQKLLIPKDIYLKIVTSSNLPIKAGLASSASGFAALTKALAKLFNWNLSLTELSKLARLGSGSASRSLWHGLVKWHAGTKVDGTDCEAELIDTTWSELCVGLLIIDKQEKYLNSREAMELSVNSSPFYQSWVNIAQNDLKNLELAILNKDFGLLGKTAESNALAMHAVMLSTRPSILYSSADTINYIKKIWQLRENNIDLYFTQDAGPNLKLLFLEQDAIKIKTNFPEVEIIRPFDFIWKN